MKQPKRFHLDSDRTVHRLVEAASLLNLPTVEHRAAATALLCLVLLDLGKADHDGEALALVKDWVEKARAA